MLATNANDSSIRWHAEAWTRKPTPVSASGMRAAPVPLEGQAHAQLNFARRKCRGECKWLVRVKIRAAVDRKGRCESRANHVIYTGIIGVVSEIKALRSKVQRSLLAEFKRTAQTQIEIGVAWTDSRVSSALQAVGRW